MAHKRVTPAVIVHPDGSRKTVEIETPKHDRPAAREALAQKLAEHGGKHGALKRDRGREGRKVLPAQS